MEDYELQFVSTADGKISIEGYGIDDVPVKANETYKKTIKLHGGANYFVITFTPDPNFKPLKGDALTSYEPYTFEHVNSRQQYRNDG